MHQVLRVHPAFLLNLNGINETNFVAGTRQRDAHRGREEIEVLVGKIVRAGVLASGIGRHNIGDVLKAPELDELALKSESVDRSIGRNEIGG